MKTQVNRLSHNFDWVPFAGSYAFAIGNEHWAGLQSRVFQPHLAFLFAGQSTLTELAYYQKICHVKHGSLP